jgi:hypothetical protein
MRVLRFPVQSVVAGADAAVETANCPLRCPGFGLYFHASIETKKGSGSIIVAGAKRGFVACSEFELQRITPSFALAAYL